MNITFYFRHYGTRVVSIGGTGQQLPEMTCMRLEVDEKANPADAPQLCSSYTLEDMFGLIVGGCFWCNDLKALGEWLTCTLWQRDKPAKTPTISVTKILYSRIEFNGLGELGSKAAIAA